MILWLALSAVAADWHVALGGTGDGSAGAPFGEVQDGLDVAMPGDVVVVAPGSYAPIQTVRDGADGQRITVRADPAGLAVISAAGTALDGGHPWHTFDGVVFDGGFGGDDVLKLGGSDHLELLGVEVRHAYGGDCIDLRSASDVLVEGAYIHHCISGSPGAQADSHGITGDSVFDLTIRDSRIGWVTGDAVQLSPPRLPWDNLVIERCELWSGPLDQAAGPMPAGEPIGENALDTKVGSGLPRVVVRDVDAWGWEGAVSNAAAFNLKEDVDALLERVSVWDSEIAFRLRYPAAVEVRNAEVWDSLVAFRVEDGLTDARIAAVTVGLGVDQVFRDAGGEPVGISVQNLLHAAPLGESWPLGGTALEVDGSAFVDAATGDYRLADGSPAIDAGAALAGFSDDRSGAARPYGAAWDLGAWEWGATPPGTATGGTGTGTGGPGGTGTGGPGVDPAGEDKGCGCVTGGPQPGWLALLALIPSARRRRRRTA